MIHFICISGSSRSSFSVHIFYSSWWWCSRDWTSRVISKCSGVETHHHKSRSRIFEIFFCLYISSIPAPWVSSSFRRHYKILKYWIIEVCDNNFQLLPFLVHGSNMLHFLLFRRNWIIYSDNKYSVRFYKKFNVVVDSTLMKLSRDHHYCRQISIDASLSDLANCI